MLFRLLNFIFKFVFKAVTFLIAFIDNAFSSKSSLVLEAKISPNLGAAKKVLVYAHWSKKGNLRIDELDLFDVCLSNDWNVVLVKNVDKTVTDDNSDLFKAGISILKRKNRGRDLAAYRDAIYLLDEIGLSPETILFMNSSVLYRRKNMGSFLDRISSSERGLTPALNSNQPFEHFQTFAFVFRNTNIKEIANYLKSMRNSNFKSTAIYFGELALSRQANLNFQINVPLFQLNELIHESLELLDTSSFYSNYETSRSVENMNSLSLGNSFNPSHRFWRELLELGFPGIKIELLTKNPANIRDLPMVEKLFPDLGTALRGIGYFGEVKRPRDLVLRLRRKIKF